MILGRACELALVVCPTSPRANTANYPSFSLIPHATPWLRDIVNPSGGGDPALTQCVSPAHVSSGSILSPTTLHYGVAAWVYGIRRYWLSRNTESWGFPLPLKRSIGHKTKAVFPLATALKLHFSSILLTFHILSCSHFILRRKCQPKNKQSPWKGSRWKQKSMYTLIQPGEHFRHLPSDLRVSLHFCHITEGVGDAEKCSDPLKPISFFKDFDSRR